MPQKGVVFTTTLTVKECANVFRAAGDSARGGIGKLREWGARSQGHGDNIGYYTPAFDSPFAAIDGTPDFAIGVNILKFSMGSPSAGTHIHMYVDDDRDTRTVQLVSTHGLMDGGRSARLAQKFLEQFQVADRRLEITDGNL